MDEDESSRESSQNPAPPEDEELNQPQPGDSSDDAGASVVQDADDTSFDALQGVRQESGNGAPDDHQQDTLQSRPDRSEEGAAGPAYSAVDHEQSVALPDAGTLRSESAEPADASKLDDSAPMELESPPFSPAPVGPSAGSIAVHDKFHKPGPVSTSLPDQISSISQPHEEAGEVGSEVPREVHVVSS